MKKKMLITGTGFLASAFELRGFDGYDVEVVGRSKVDLSDKEAVEKYFKDKRYDVVLHTAITGGRRSREDTPDTLQTNMDIFYNVLQIPTDVFVSFGSGAEYNRAENITDVDEISDFNIPFPLVTETQDYYGLSKLHMSRDLYSRAQYLDTRYFNLRIFSAFGEYEDPIRFVRSAIIAAENDEDIEVHGNRKMSFIYVGDIHKIVDEIIRHPTKYFMEYGQMNLVYPAPDNCMDLEFLGRTISKMMYSSSEVKNQGEEFNDYYASGKLMTEFLKRSKIKLDGFYVGLEKTIKHHVGQNYNSVFFGGGRF